MDFFDWWSDTTDPEATGQTTRNAGVFAVFGKRTSGGPLGAVSAPQPPQDNVRPFRPTRAAMVSREPASSRVV